jgi:zinc and cadmium transporter
MLYPMHINFMISPTVAIFGSVALVSLFSLIGAILLAFSHAGLKRLMMYLVSFSTGALLGNVFIHILPELTQEPIDTQLLFLLVLVGFMGSFVIERFVHWRHCHSPDCDAHAHPMGYLMLIGDSVHNFLDGILIAVAYLVSIPIGITTTIAVLLHEIPQELGDFAILLHSGFSRAKALLFNFLSAVMSVFGAILVLLLSANIQGIEIYLLPLAAGNFLYIAGSDLIPELHREQKPLRMLLQMGWMIAGILVMYAL